MDCHNDIDLSNGIFLFQPMSDISRIETDDLQTTLRNDISLGQFIIKR